MMKPIIIVRPPRAVTSRAVSAPLRAFSCSYQKPISRNDVRLVISQKMKSRIRSSASATPSMAPMKASSAA